MKRTILLLLAFLWIGTSASAVERFVRPLGGTTTQCTGLANVDYDGFGTGEACAYSSAHDVITAGACGDNLNLLAGGTWDGTFTLPDKGCTVSTPITLRSSAHASLPVGRVGPADVANMPRLRTLGSGGAPAIQAAASADYWIVDGIEITDNAGTSSVNWLVDYAVNTSVDNMTIQRCYFHQKEVGPGTPGDGYRRSVQYGVNWGGDNLTLKWNYIFLAGYPISGSDPMQTMFFTANPPAGGLSGILVEDNYINVWYSAFYAGGSDTTAAHTATLASGATMTQATFSSTTGLVAGAVILLSVNVRGTLSAFTGTPGDRHATLTRVSGATLTDADAGLYTTVGNAMKVVGGSPNLNVDLQDTTGDVYTVRESTSWDGPNDQTYDWELLATVQVNTVNTGTGVVTYTPYGTNRLAQNPSTPGKAQWSAGDEGLVNDITLRKNTIYIDPAFGEYARTTNDAGHNNQGPKGYWEIKNCNRMTVEGNRIGGWPAVMAWTGSNQNGGSPWTTVRDIIVRNNWIEPLVNATTIPHIRQAFIITENTYRTGKLAANFQVYNNVFKGYVGLISSAYVDNQSYTHNTFINNNYADPNAIVAMDVLHTTGFVFSDNIVTYSGYGFNCYLPPGTVAACFNPNTIQNNVIVDDWPRGPGVVYANVWGSGSTAGSIAASFTALGFTSLAGDVLSLAASSPYKGLGTGSTDPGVDWAALQAALTGANNPPTTGAGLDQNLGPVTSTTLIGTASDPDGDTPLTYSWVRTSGPNSPTIVTSTALTTLVTGMTTGTYVFTLTVTDPDGASSSDMMSVTIAGSGAVTTCRWQSSPVCIP